MIFFVGINTECNTNDDCGLENSTCIAPAINNSKNETIHNTCQCKKGFVHFEDQCLKAGVYIKKIFTKKIS